MSRLTKLGLLLACAIGVGGPSPSEAGVIPWMYDALFGPVGSMRRSYYAPYYAGYAPYTTGYSEYSAGYPPAAYPYGFGNDGSCCQPAPLVSAFNGCDCSPCGQSCPPGCAYGNCATGQCSANLSPSGSLSPTPDPNYSRGIENRLDVIEKHLNILPPRDPAPPREPNGPRPRTYDDDFNRALPRNRLPGNDSSSESSPGTGTEAEPFSEPTVRPKSRGTRSDGTELEPFQRNTPKNETDGTSRGGQRETFKAPSEGPEIGPPADAGEVIPQKKPAPSEPVEEQKNKSPQALRLDSRLTSKAVSPRERQVISSGFQKPVVASSKPAAPTSNWAGNPRAAELARH